MTNKKWEARVAYHEAGHAVAARLLGIGITYVTLLPVAAGGAASTQAHSAARSAWDKDVSSLLAAIEKDTIVVLSGPHAGYRFHPADGPKHQKGCSQDRAAAMDHAELAILIENKGRALTDDEDDGETLAPEDAARAVLMAQDLEKQAEALVAENWPAITRVAEALLIRRVLNQADVDELIARAGLPTVNAATPGRRTRSEEK